jgi:hypothetical protein
VLCDISADDLLTSAEDPKEFCRNKYANDVVVHIPVPNAPVVCNPPADAISADTCGRLPWLIGIEGQVDKEEGDRRRGQPDRKPDRGTDDETVDEDKPNRGKPNKEPPADGITECKTGGPICDDLRKKKPVRACGNTCVVMTKNCSDKSVAKAKKKGAACNLSGKTQKQTQAKK